MKTWLVCLLFLAGSAHAAAPHALMIHGSPRLLPRTAFVPALPYNKYPGGGADVACALWNSDNQPHY